MKRTDRHRIERATRSAVRRKMGTAIRDTGCHGARSL
jgi:hypothetical protein